MKLTCPKCGCGLTLCRVNARVFVNGKEVIKCGECGCQFVPDKDELNSVWASFGRISIGNTAYGDIMRRVRYTKCPKCHANVAVEVGKNAVMEVERK